MKLAVLLLLVPALAWAVAANQTGALDGRQFDVKLTEKDLVKGSKPIDDQITFTKGRLVSAWLREQGWTAELKVTATSKGDAIAFTARGKHKRQGEVVVNGVLQIAGRRLISGRIVWNKKGEQTKQLEFAGIEAGQPASQP